MNNEKEEIFIAIVQNSTKKTILQHQLFSHMQVVEPLSQNILERVLIADSNNNIVL